MIEPEFPQQQVGIAIVNSGSLNANGVSNGEKAIVNGKGELEPMPAQPPPYEETPNKNEKMKRMLKKRQQQSASAPSGGSHLLRVWNR